MNFRNITDAPRLKAPALRDGVGTTACTLLSLALLIATSANAAVASSPDVDAQYSAVLAAMKNPPAAGVLVTEIGPESAAGAAGLQAGDIIYHYAGSEIRDLPTLRQSIADIFASHAAGDSDTNVLLAVHRNGANIILQVPRAPLGIRAIEVEAGVPATPNPLPSPRGTITLAWNDLIRQQIVTAEGASFFFRTDETIPPAASASQPSQSPTPPVSTWINWQHRSLNVGESALLGQLDTYQIDADTAKISSSESVRFRLRTGDYTHEPAFVLESVDIMLDSGDGSITTTTDQRKGPMIVTQSQTVSTVRSTTLPEVSLPCPLSAIVPGALPVLAAAMPHETNAALSLSLLSIRDAISRPGYVLITRGSQSVRAEKGAPSAWRVDLLHCGVLIETYWFTDQRRLLQIDSPSGTSTITRRVSSQDEASRPVTPKSSK